MTWLSRTFGGSSTLKEPIEFAPLQSRCPMKKGFCKVSCSISRSGRYSEVVCGATTEVQAGEVFRPAKAMVEQRKTVFAQLGVVAAAKSVYQAKTRSKFRPVIGKAKYGGSPYCAILDEAHQLQDSQLYDAFKTGCNKRRNSLLLTISTAGVQSRENPCYQQQQDVQKVLESVIDNDRLFGIVYTINDEMDWASREAVIMANPNLGIRNMQAWAKCYDPDLTEEVVKNLPCWIGSDLASKLDLSATVRLFRQDIDGRPHYYAFARTYLPEAQVNAPENQHYQKWSKQGFLTATPGNSIDYSMIEADTEQDIASSQVQNSAQL